jgi:hypothetical protein
MAQQTAVDWLFIQLYEKFEMKGDGMEMDKVFEQAKQMEKEQIENAWSIGVCAMDNSTAEQYYNETFKSE